MSTPTPKSLSPEQLAALSGMSRRTIMRAIKSFKLKAIRNNKNHWDIDYNSALLWMARDDVSGRAQPNAHPEQTGEVSALLRENADLRSRVEAAERDRDAWREQARRDQDALHKATRRWWHWR